MAMAFATLVDMTNGVCRICGNEGPLSFEHIPPQSVGNNHTVKLYSGIDTVKSSLTGQNNMDGMKYQQSQRGQGFKTICRSCNSYLGQNYVKPFSEFYIAAGQQVHVSDFHEKDKFVHFETDRLMPLAFVKQVISNFCTSAGDMCDCKDYLLDRENSVFPQHYRLHMFIVGNLHEPKLFTGWIVPIFADCTFCKMACIGIPPFAFTLFDYKSSTTPPEWPGDITNLTKVPWGEKPRIKFQLPLLKAPNYNNPLSWGSIGMKH